MITEEEEEAYRQTATLLETSRNLAKQLSSIPTLVPLRDIVREPPLDDEPPSTLLTPNKGHHALSRALEDLEKLEAEVVLEQDVLHKMTRVVTGTPLETGEEALQALQELGKTIPRRVCQHPFRRHDIVWVCRTCQADETCVLCHECFSHSNHEGHDVAFYHAQAGGCCDCGDPDAWDPAGFCPHHGPSSSSARTGEGGLDVAIVNRVRGIVPATVDWLVSTIAANAEKAHQRAKPSRPETAGADSNGDNDSLDDDDAMALDLEHTFVPSAASTSKSRHGSLNTSFESDTPSVTQRLGADGLEGHGLFLILHADDIHTNSQLVEAFRDLYGGSSYLTDTLLGRLVRMLKQYGQLVVWGTMEVVGVCSTTHVHCWLDGDMVASSRIGSVLLGKATLLARHGLVCSIATRTELQFEQRAVAILQWLLELARSCDPLCQTVAESILPERHLVPMLRSDFKLSAHITNAWHSLLLNLLAVPAFKSHLAAAYCDTYRYVTAEYAGGMGVLERSGYTLSVQFLNRVTYVVGLVQGRDLLGKLGKSLLETLSVAMTSNKRLNPNHFVLTHRRYSPCISDLKCVLNVKGMARVFASSAGTFLQDWIDSLSLAQFMDGVVWRTVSQGHVVIEPRGWVGAFNASISLGSLFERFLSWDDDDASPIDPAQSPLAQNLQTCVDLTFYIMTHGLAQWQSTEMVSYVSKADDTDLGDCALCPASLPFSTVASKQGTQLAFDALPIAQTTQWSFHLPLHRFVAAALREVCRRPDQSAGMAGLMQQLTQVPAFQRDGLFRGLMEFPALVISRATQIRAGLWRRNGSGMNDQVLNYAEPPFCRALRDADILLLQFAALGCKPGGVDMGCSLMVHLLLHRFGLFDFLGFAKAPNSNIHRYKEELVTGLYDPELKTEAISHTIEVIEEGDMVLPWTYTPATDVASLLALLEDFLHLLIVLMTEVPPLPPKDKEEHTLQAKQRLRREVVHRLASGPKTHSELSEVHHVLSHWDNVFLSEEGKLLNPDDASGAALGKALSQVAERKSSRGKVTPDQWELNREAWDAYDPAFFHISMRCHQSATENRPKPSSSSGPFGVEAKPFAPFRQSLAHPFFQRLERDITADATVLAIAYRTLHVHCSCHNDESRDVSSLGGAAIAYHSDAMSETALARAVHLLTLGAFAWADASADDREWKIRGGSSAGSIFHALATDAPAPTARDWVFLALMSPPSEMMDSPWYAKEEKTLVLLRRLAVDGGKLGGFISQDRALRSGAAWLCEFAAKNNAEAKTLIGSKSTMSSEENSGENGKSDLERRKQAAKARAMERMKAQATRFADQMKIENEDIEDDGKQESENNSVTMSHGLETPPRAYSRGTTFGSERSLNSASSASRSPQRSDLGIPQFFSMYSDGGEVVLDDSENDIPDRLLKDRPQCIICVEDVAMVPRETEFLCRGVDEESNRKPSRRKTASNALAFVGYSQASTVLKGGGGPPPALEDNSPLASVRRFAGTHVSLCGHAIHSECCESYLASVALREDRLVGRRDEFRCPGCRSVSNCLVPFIDVGVDWTESPNWTSEDSSLKSSPADGTGSAVKSSSDDEASDLILLDENGQSTPDLHSFLSTTPWWITRNDKSVVWDGQCAFIASESLTAKDDNDQGQEMNIDDGSPRISRKRSVRSLRKKDLYAAWTAMMRTPRFVRRRLRPKNSTISDDPAIDSRGDSGSSWPSSETSSGETVVWRRLMDLLTDTSFKADGKRLGERYLHIYCGEFRHFITEKSAYNIVNRESGKQNVEWPACISSTILPDARRQELSREKLLSKLLMSVQAFTYSCCCESREAKRLLRKEAASHGAAVGLEQDATTIQPIFSTYGISGVTCDGKLVLMPPPSNENDGTQPFNGRLGKLRYFGLAVMAAAGAVSADLVQLVMGFPLDKEVPVSSDPLTAYFDHPARAPVAFPLLLGHVLTHVVAAICATCGRARARSDSLELAWPAPFSRRGSFCVSSTEKEDLCSNVVNDCAGFIKLGLLARLLQILLNRMDIKADAKSDERDAVVLTNLSRMMEEMANRDSKDAGWLRICFSLLEKSLSKNTVSNGGSDQCLPAGANVFLEEQFRNACSVAASEIVAFISDVGIIFQLLVPGAITTFKVQNIGEYTEHDTDLSGTLETLEKLQKCLGLESFEHMLQSSVVHDIVWNWCEAARTHSRSSAAEESELFHSSKVRSRLFTTEGFRAFDWPMESIRPYVEAHLDKMFPTPQEVGTAVMQSFTNPIRVAHSELEPVSTDPLVAFSSKKSVKLIGGYVATGRELSNLHPHPRVTTLATSYTDLYATLGTLCPDSEQTALCLICGQVLNAGGKGECTKHSYYCGAGSCIFFLLQECVGLVLHGDFALYVHSPYVDSHGETPQYRGRPLNLDLDRYNLLHEMWSGHTVRLNVVKEREGARQLIIENFY